MILKRILIILGIMCITSLSCAGLLMLGNKDNNSDNEVEIYEEENNIVDVQEVINTDNIVVEESKQEEKVEENILNVENVDNQATNNETISSTVINNEIKQHQNTVKQETKKQEENIVVSEQKEENTTEEKNINEVVMPENQETKKEETDEKNVEEVVPQVKDEYKRNNTMIEQMRNVIINNESDLMKELGYNIVVDSSIITETNQFTFTETRVKNKIINAFGTIKIYAQDYYHNGQYMYTECYLM